MKPVYITMFIDACVFTYAMKMVTEGDGIWSVLAFAFGKVYGAHIATVVEDKIAIGILEVSLYASGQKALTLADTLREMGYGVTTIKGYGLNGQPRFTLDITLERKEFPLLKKILHKFDYDDATMVVRELKSVSGKIKTSRIEKEM